jgi:acyl-homoserine-lactone acylase
MLRDEAAFTVDKLVAAKHSTHSELADRMLDELINAARKSDNEEAKNAAEVLSQWDRSAEAGSRGALLFVDFASRWLLAPGAQPFEKPWSPADPLGTPRQIADTSKAITLLAQAGEAAASRYGSMDAAWGDVNRFSRDNVDLPGNGGPGHIGIFRVIDYSPRLAAHTKASGGDSFVAAVEFSNPVRAKVVIAYGNSSQPGSRHATDQLEFAAKKQMRTAWLTRSDVESHLESRDVLQ